MDKLKWKLQNFMQGRNGLDMCAKTVLIGSLILYCISGVLRNGFLYYLALIGIIYSLFRVFSRNLSKRREENKKLLDFVSLNKSRFAQRKEYKIFKCQGCGRNIRVPRGKGKLEITCPICGRKIIKRT